MDQLGLVRPVDRLGQRVVVAVAFAAHRGFDAGFSQSLGVADADVLGGFNRSSQHRIAARILGSRSRLLRESSIRASSVAVR